MNATATRITAKDIRLSRVSNGFYAYNAPHFAASYTIIKQAAGVWTVAVRYTPSKVEEVWMMDSLNAARSFIAADMVERNLI